MMDCRMPIDTEVAVKEPLANISTAIENATLVN